MNILYCLRHARQVHGDKPAIEHDGRQINWREFSSIVENTAHGLTRLGVKKGDRVAVLMANSPAYLDLYYSITMAGAIIVPLNTRWAIEEMRSTLEDSGSTLLFADDRFSALASELGKIRIAPPFKMVSGGQSSPRSVCLHPD